MQQLKKFTLCIAPVSNDGRGLKQLLEFFDPLPPNIAPVSNDGRGLKQVEGGTDILDQGSRPSAMTGED